MLISPEKFFAFNCPVVLGFYCSPPLLAKEASFLRMLEEINDSTSYSFGIGGVYHQPTCFLFYYTP